MFHDIIKKVPVRDYGIDGLEVHVDHTSTGTVYYFIPAGLRHQITLHAGYSEVDYVDDPND